MTWRAVTLGDLVTSHWSGYSFRSDDYTPDGVPVLTKGDVKPRGLIQHGSRYVDPELIKAKSIKLTSRQELLVTTRDLTTAANFLGLVAKAPESLAYAVNQGVTVFRVDESKVNRDFLAYWCEGDEYRGHVKGHYSGATQIHIRHGDLMAAPVRLPPHAEQRRIASILSAYDDLIENNTRRIAVLEEMARRIYEEWFVRFRFPGHERVRMVESELGLVPEGWSLLAASTAMDINPSTKVPKEGLKPFLAMNCLSDDSMLIDAPGEREGNSGSKFRNGDTLFARITPCLENGKTGFVQFLPNDDAVAFGSTEFIVLRSRTLTPEFVYLLARSDAFRDNAIKSMSGASGRQRVREACFDAFLLANPDQETLTKFAAVTRPMFQLIQSLALKNFNLRTTRDLLLPKLIAGELDVSTMSEPKDLAA